MTSAVVAFAFAVTPDLQAQGGRRLFEASRQPAADRPQNPHRPRARRERAARMRLDALSERGVGTARVVLNLFDDFLTGARLERYQQRAPGSFTWHGRVDGDRGHATFVATDGVVAGTIFMDDGAFEVGYLGGDEYEIREIDPLAFPTDDPAQDSDLTPPLDTTTSDPPQVLDDASEIDVLVLWTPAAEAAAGGSASIQSTIDLAVANTNTAYTNSGITTRVRLVHKALVSYTESTPSADLSRLATSADGYVDVAHSLRDQYGADMVSLVGAGYSAQGACGIGYLMTSVGNSFAPYAFTVVDWSCAAGNLSFAHELGHNQGMHHDPAVTSTPGAYSYSYGYVDPACSFRTIMAYGSCTRVTQFSSPSVSVNGRVTGTASQNNALTLNNTAATVANFRQAVIGSTCTYTLSSATYTAPSTGGSNTVTLTAGTGCAWTASSSATWVTITAGASGFGNGSVSYTVATNTGSATRTATLTIGGQTHTVTQPGSSCSYTLSSTSFTAPSGGVASSVSVTTATGCSWTAISNAAWVTITAGSGGTGNGLVSFSVAANSTTSQRTGTMTIAGQTYTVTQAGAADTSVTITAPSGTVSVTAAEDFAVRVLQDRWDMNDRWDLGWFVHGVDQPLSNLSSPTFSSGVFTATASTSDPSVFLLETGNPVAATAGRNGRVFPIDADRYRRLNFRMCLTGAASGAVASVGQLYWSRDTIYSDNSSPNSFNVYGGCTVYSMDLRTASVGVMPVIPGLQQYEWTGTMRSLRLDPTNTAGQQVTIDWASLTAVSDATATRTITWTAAGAVNLYLDNNNNSADGNLGLLWKQGTPALNVTGGSYDFQFGGLPPGDYYVAIQAVGGTGWAYSPGFYRVQAVPTVTVLSPSEEGSSDDFATMQLGNAWDMQDGADIERTANVSTGSLTTLTLETLPGIPVASQPVYRGTATAGPADPILWMLWSGGRGRNYRIDTGRYRIMTLEMGISGARDVNNGSIARLVWKRADESLENVSEDIIVNHRSGVNSVDKIILDMADRTTLPLEPGAGSPSRSGWTGMIDNLRVDPHEFSDARQFWLRRVKLAALESAYGTYTIRWRLDGVTDTTTRVALYRDTDGTGFNGTLIAQNLAYDNVGDGTGSYAWSLAGVPAGTHYIYVRATTSGGTVLNQQYARWPIAVSATPIAATQLRLDRSILRYAATRNGAQKTGPQDVGVTFTGGTASWSAAAVAPCDFVQISQGSGVGQGVFSVAMQDRTTYPSGATLNCTVRVDAPGAINSPQFVDVEFRIHPTGTTRAPFGYIDTPASGATVAGAFGVTGWALDDLQVSRITIWRSRVTGETSPHPNGLIYVGDAVTLEGARPDVEALNPTLPLAYKAGWGALVLSNQLPFGGNGVFTFHVYVSDPEGNQVLLGSRMVIGNNTASARPFGTIDTPGNGETVSGTIYNFGWALTAQPNFIPTDGSTIWVFVDGIPLGHPVYNQYRPDIAAAFPGYANTDGAVGVFTIDTTTLTNGLHTIAWSVTDSAGNVEGIGSRFFRVRN